MLKKGVDAWNAWRDENPDIRPDLSGTTLRSADLSRANLSKADLSRTNLTETNLSGAEGRAVVVHSGQGHINPGRRT
jgi:hypothetical protein